MDISVVLCTHNNAERLRVTLNSFCRLNRPEGFEWELVAVNNNSTDGTEEVIKSFVDRLPINYVYEPEQGLSRARNTGLDVAEGELIVFTDDDVKPNPDWLTAYWEAYQERTEGYYFGGPIESEFEGEPPDQDLQRAAMLSVTGLDYGPEPKELPSEEIFIGPNWACPIKHLRQVGEFDESLGLNAADGEEVSVGEESDLMSRLDKEGIRGWYVSRAKIKHFVPVEKCTLEHITSRKVGEVNAEFQPEDEEIYTLFGVPVGLYKQAIVSLIDWITRRARGKKWKSEYVTWRVWLRRIAVYHKE
jgi:glycosyltransferase involved in cell wall biosynthesis